jgi:hypothetical protein
MAAIVTPEQQAVPAEKNLEEQLKFQKRLNNITNKIHAAKDTSDILLNLQGEILSLLDADRITIYMVDGINRQIVSKFKTGNEVSKYGLSVMTALQDTAPPQENGDCQCL